MTTTTTRAALVAQIAAMIEDRGIECCEMLVSYWELVERLAEMDRQES